MSFIGNTLFRIESYFWGLQEIRKARKCNNIQALSDADLENAAIACYCAKKYTACEPFFAELYRRKCWSICCFDDEDLDEDVSSWVRCAYELYAFGYGGVAVDLEKAADLKMVILENHRYLAPNALDLLFVAADRSKKETQFQLLPVDRDRLETYFLNSLQGFKQAVTQQATIEDVDAVAEHYDNSVDMDALRMIPSFSQLDDLGYWQLPRRIDAIEKRFRDGAQQGNPAAMYWLAVCGHIGIINVSEKERQDLLIDAARQGYANAAREYLDEFGMNHSREERKPFQAIVREAERNMLKTLWK